MRDLTARSHSQHADLGLPVCTRYSQVQPVLNCPWLLRTRVAAAREAKAALCAPPALQRHHYKGVYQTDIIRDKALGYIDDAVSKKKPFLVYLAPTAPHDQVRPVIDVGLLLWVCRS